MNRIKLKSGKEYGNPSIFVNPQSGFDGRILQEVNKRYGGVDGHYGINQIDGIVVSIKDWDRVSKTLRLNQKTRQTKLGGEKEEFNQQRTLKSRVLIIDPNIDILFRGFKNDKKQLLKTGIFSTEIEEVVEKINKIKENKKKVSTQIDELYPLLDIKIIRNFLKRSIENGSDILISPSVPITSKWNFDSQLEKVLDMNRISRVLVDTVFEEMNVTRDLMHMLTLHPSALKSSSSEGKKRIEQLAQAILSYGPDHIGLKLMDLHPENTSEVRRILKLVENIRRTAKTQMEEEIPIHVFDVREFGYVTFCYGANTMTTPIGRVPYFRMAEEPPDDLRLAQGAYYHPIDMTNDDKETLYEKARPYEYRLPCHCEICNEYEKITKVDEQYWNEFRRVHFLLVKNMELKEIRETTVTLKSALKDKFARSEQTAWIPFLS